jgi:hypothetical protein
MAKADTGRSLRCDPGRARPECRLRLQQRRPYGDCVTARRTLGTGPQAAHNIRAAQADVLDVLPGVRLPDLDEPRACGVLGAHTATSPAPLRTLGVGGPVDEKPPHLSA